MEHLARDPTPRTRVYHLMAEGMAFKVTVALCARRVEKRIRDVKRDFLDAATTKCVGLDCEFTDPSAGGEHFIFKSLTFLNNKAFIICPIAVDFKILIIWPYYMNNSYII
jgi:hypothetical protein